MLQKPDSFEVKGDLPGVKEENVKLSVDGDVLSLSVENVGEKKDEVREEVSFTTCLPGNPIREEFAYLLSSLACMIEQQRLPF